MPRKIAFWLWDSLKTNPIRKHLASIKMINENPFGQASRIKNEGALKNLLKHAINTVPFYNDISSEGIESYPVVNKNLIKNNFGSFESSSFHNTKRIKQTTSGSTGTPFTVLHDINKRNRNTADTIYFGELAGYNLGSKLFYLKKWNDQNYKSISLQWKQNIIPVDVFDLNDKEISSLIGQLKTGNKDKNLLGYASAYDAIARYIQKENLGALEVNVKSIIAMSEALSDTTKKILGNCFKCDVLSRYSNIENGILAQQIPGFNNNFLINSASYYIEILDFNSDNQVKNGEPGRIVVTDLFNYAMPMIRYDTGDVGKYDIIEKNGNSFPVLRDIEGRKMDIIFNTNGEIISSFLVTNSMWKYDELRQYQFIQKSKIHYLFKLNIDGSFEREEELITEFKSYLGRDALIDVEYVDEIPILFSGKRRKVANLMK
ncbi:CoF synthetase [Flavobacteriaceae bacterium F89]|uniref:CoF synthetase n=1 Tax=Cerina litoralis TaxID=2874477 RepID=A0AAE3JRC6_9FLAO|nr:CoF synthetase [Cerina litoralis]MCG2461188.1 CoF synthetase [Cerina litoralis]